jgi:hypothetical protein
MTELPIILDDLIEEELQNQIEDTMFDCRWKFKTDNIYEYDASHMGLKYRKFLNPLNFDISPAFISNISSFENRKTYFKINPLIRKGCNKIKFNIEKIQRCCGAIHAITTDTSKIDNIHVNRDVPHLVMLYYVNDSDGDTILYDKTREEIPLEVLWPDEYCNLNITNRISPKKGRVLFFDGRTYHAPSGPTKGIRCIITLDLFGEFEDGSYKFPAPKEIIKNKFTYQ